MHLRRILKLSALAALPLAGIGPASAESIFGSWLTDDRAAIIRVEKCGQQLCGVIEKVLDPRAPDNDVNNPDPRQRSNPLVGTRILRSFVGSGAVWVDGLAYDPKAGESYRSKLRLLSNGALKVTGCVLFICRSRYWSRAN
jgi:uncharacterized protein (DUF2147 family)